MEIVTVTFDNVRKSTFDSISKLMDNDKFRNHVIVGYIGTNLFGKVTVDILQGTDVKTIKEFLVAMTESIPDPM